MSNYNGTDASLPPVTTFEIPSYAVISDGIYPPTWPQHPNPPPPLVLVTNEFPPGPREITILDADIAVRNTPRAPVLLDLRAIADEMRQTTW